MARRKAPSRNSTATQPRGYASTPMTCTSSAGQRLLDRGHETGVVGGGLGRESGGNGAVRRDQKLLEVPSDVAGVAGVIRDVGQCGVERVTIWAIHVHLLRQRECHAVVDLAELGDVGGAARL